MLKSNIITYYLKVFLKQIPFLILIWFITSCDGEQESDTQLEWPAISKENKPWTRWWWHGSAVTKEDITADLEALQKGGIGGVEITPIFGVIGQEEKFIDYLSQKWMEMLVFSLQEADRLGLGVDMATGTGWPFGGPWVGAEDAPKNMLFTTYELGEGESLDQEIKYIQESLLRAIPNPVYQLHEKMNVAGDKIPAMLKEPKREYFGDRLEISQLKEPVSANNNLQALALEQIRYEKSLPLITLMAYSDTGEKLELTDKVDEAGNLDWTATAGNWNLYAIFQGWHGKLVERAAPNGEGNVIDHFSATAIDNYLQKFDSAFAGYDITGLRGYFNDSYEVDDGYGEANFTPDFFNEFEQRRGYDLKDYLPVLFSEDSAAINLRVLSDYRETFSDLLLEKFTLHWKTWATSKNSIIRNQAHGSPANILDLYAASDIPETEGAEIIKIKMASSAANVTGKKYTSSEAATWLNEHFQSTPQDIKENLDRYLLGGVNHVFYHGTAFSPQDEPWPGWLFYAAVHANPRNSIWNNITDINTYITRVQSFLQNSQPDNDVLLYYPIYDRLAHKGRSMLEHFGARGPVYEASAVKINADLLQENGYAFDFISDKQIESLTVSEMSLNAPGGTYQTIVVPECEFISLNTFEKLYTLAKGGANIIVHKSLPSNLNGLGNLEARQQKFESLRNDLKFTPIENKEIQQANVGEGRFLLGNSLSVLLDYAAVRNETLPEKKLEFIRKKNNEGEFYFIVNHNESEIEGWVNLSAKAVSVVIFNPVNGNIGRAKLRKETGGGVQVLLQLKPRESCILQTYNSEVNIDPYKYYETTGSEIPITGSWKVKFIEGGPELPAEVNTENLSSWTHFEGEALQHFSGTASYTIDINRPNIQADAFELNLGDVAVGAQVLLNGEKIGALSGPSFKIIIPNEQWQEKNVLDVRVSNLMANRIAWMDKSGIFWKKFYNVNFPARLEENRKFGMFSAENWEPVKSGLLGPVTLTPLKTY